MRQHRIDNILSVMAAIDKGDCVPVSAIVKSVNLSVSVTRMILGHLVDSEYVTIRQKDSDGRRRVHYTLTLAGLAYLEKGEPKVKRAESRPICGDWSRA